MPMTHLKYKAVIFDIGGVVLRSPFIAIDAYERELGIPSNYLNCSIAARGNGGAWQRFERGELSLFAFYDAFGRDLSDTRHGNEAYTAYCRRRGLETAKLPTKLDIDGRELFGRMMRHAAEYDPHILLALTKLRAAGGHRIVALTNNFSQALRAGEIPPSELAFLGWEEGVLPRSVSGLFDDFCDSSVFGMRKPEREFYLLACRRNNVRPDEAIFLDDIKLNLKVARELGMETIHVPIAGSLGAVKKLEEMLGLDLTSGVSAKL